MTESLRLRVHGDAALPTFIYLPGLHGDWTLLGAFRAALVGRARLIEVSYPRRTDWTLDDYAASVEQALAGQGIQQGWFLAESFSSQVGWTLVRRSLDRAEARNRNDPVREPSRGCDAPAQQVSAAPRRANSRHAIQKTASPGDGPSQPSLELSGLILVGGFIKHPWPWAVHLAHRVSRAAPFWLLRRACALYGWMASRRHGDSSELCAELREFVARRTEEADRAAITSRYVLISGHDPRTVAQRATLPVWHLSGGIDPIVPWWLVRPWLHRHCPGYRASRILRRAGHNVLLDAAQESADQILRWIGEVGQSR